MRYYVMVGLVAAAAAPLFAQTTPAPVAGAPMAATHVARSVTHAEVQTRVQTHFAKRDTNRDGILTTDELMSSGGHHGMKMRHHGGKGERAMRDPNAAFDRIDANRDGSISRDEFARAREVRIEKRVVVKGDGQPGAMHGMRHGGGGMAVGAMIKLADANRDGRVTLAEATTGALRHFDMMDANRDGQLTPQERAAGRAHMRQMRKAG